MDRYIHARPGWPALAWNAEALAPALSDLRHRQGRLVGRMEALGFALQSQALLETLTEDVVTSSRIEGENLARSDVRSSIARRLGLDAAATPPAGRDVEGVVEMMLDATQRYEQPLTEERLHAWHASLFLTARSGMRPITVGAWRSDAQGPMQVVSGPIGHERVHFEAPPAARVPAEMRAFLQWFEGEQDIDTVLKAGLAHLWFVTVHPFDDGNGRIARAIADMALARSERSPLRFYSMSAQTLEERSEYYAQLESAQKGGLDVTPWLQWFLGCLGRALVGAQVLLGDVLVRARFWDRHAGATLNPRQRTVIERLLDGFEGKLTTSKWAKLAHCSQDSALRDIDDLVRRGILVRDAGGGRSTSYSLVRG